jgi:hypothetical protein
MADKTPFRMKLTPEQQAAIRKATGKNAEALELSVEELEERIAPLSKLAPSRGLVAGRPDRAPRVASGGAAPRSLTAVRIGSLLTQNGWRS